jgi:NAD-dependent SIR2 family protein deacetylase
LARAGGAVVVIVNADSTPYDAMADAVVSDQISDVLPAILGRPRANR